VTIRTTLLVTVVGGWGGGRLEMLGRRGLGPAAAGPGDGAGGVAAEMAIGDTGDTGDVAAWGPGEGP
jgi:hypothetical protein